MESATITSIRDGIRDISTGTPNLSQRTKTLLSIAFQLLDENAYMPPSRKPEVARMLQHQAVERSLHLIDVAKAITAPDHSVQDSFGKLLNDCFFLEARLSEDTKDE